MHPQCKKGPALAPLVRPRGDDVPVVIRGTDFRSNRNVPQLERSHFSIVAATPGVRDPLRVSSKHRVPREVDGFSSLPHGENLVAVSNPPRAPALARVPWSLRCTLR